MRLDILRSDQRAAAPSGAIHGDLFKWLMRLVAFVRLYSVPVGGIIPAYLSSAQIAENFDATGLGGGDYAGFAICNGQNGTPDLNDRYLLMSTSGASDATVGSHSSAHTHAIDHDHGSFTSGSESAHTHEPGSLHARMDFNPTQLVGQRVDPVTSYNYNASVDATGYLRTTGLSTADAQGIAVGGTSAAGSAHSHSVDVPALTGSSGAASATDNRPASKTLVPLMRVS